MPPTRCSYVKCKNTSKDYAMFRFPTGHEKRLAAWLSNCGNEAISHLTHQEIRNRYLCITHFSDKFIQNEFGKRKRISKLAVPYNHNDEQSSDMTPPSPPQDQDNSPSPSTSEGKIEFLGLPEVSPESPIPYDSQPADPLNLYQVAGSTSGRPIKVTSSGSRLPLIKLSAPTAIRFASAGDCRKNWQCLRDAYRRTLNKKKRKDKLEAKDIKPWRYESEMAFVAPFIIGRKTKDSVGATSGDEQWVSGEEKDATEFNTSEKPDIDIKVEDTGARISDGQNEPQQIDTKLPNVREEISSQKKRKVDLSDSAQIRNLSADKSVRTVLLSKLVEDHSKLEPPRGHDDLDRFFLSMADTVKKFPPYVQALTKNKIFALVSEMELQQLATSSSTFKPSPKTSTSVIPTPTYPDNRKEQIQQFFQKFNTPKKK